jgi:hypothetical protein
MSSEVSHGRGGAGNFNPDTNTYGDGEVVRVGVEGSHGDGAYSAGRGGEQSFSCRDGSPSSSFFFFSSSRMHCVDENIYPEIIANDVAHVARLVKSLSCNFLAATKCAESGFGCHSSIVLELSEVTGDAQGLSKQPAC